jgi:hypothetical protein
MYKCHLQAPHPHELEFEFIQAKHQPNVLEVNWDRAWPTQKSKWWYNYAEGIDLNRRCPHIPIMHPLHPT